MLGYRVVFTNSGLRICGLLYDTMMMGALRHALIEASGRWLLAGSCQNISLTSGNSELRRLIALRYAEAGVDVAPDDIVITCLSMSITVSSETWLKSA